MLILLEPSMAWLCGGSILFRKTGGHIETPAGCRAAERGLKDVCFGPQMWWGSHCLMSQVIVYPFSANPLCCKCSRFGRITAFRIDQIPINDECPLIAVAQQHFNSTRRQQWAVNDIPLIHISQPAEFVLRALTYQSCEAIEWPLCRFCCNRYQTAKA